MRRFVMLALVLALKEAHCLQSSEDPVRISHDYTKDNTQLLSARAADGSEEACKKLAKQAGAGVLQNFLGLFGTTGVLAGTFVASKSQIEAALKYTEQCSHPRYGPIDKVVLLTKWNSKGNFIYPGTKWCGSGNVSSGPGDYGPAQTTDKCCEIHDGAQDYILADAYHVNHTKLKNPRKHTVTNCLDDMKLFNCLYEDNSTVSLQFGQAFFDALQVPCFIETYPKVCTRWSYNLLGMKSSCVEYYIDTGKEKEWQFFYPPSFYRAFVRRWYKGYKMGTVTEAPDTWNLFCKNDTDIDCSGYEFIKREFRGI